MVYCGKPSKGCSNCRERKIRCDQREPGCGQCQKRQQQCPGYRNLMDLMFRDESSHVIKKATKARGRKRNPHPSTTAVSHFATISTISTTASASPEDPDPVSSAKPTPDPPSSRTLALLTPNSITNAADAIYRWTLPVDDADDDDSDDDDGSLLPSPDEGTWPALPVAALLYTLAPSFQERGTAYFFSRYVAVDENACHQNYDFVYDIWRPVTMLPERQVDGVMASMTAVGLAGLSSLTKCPKTMEGARRSYGTALRLTNDALMNPKEATKDATMLSVLILSTYEMLTGRTPQTMRAWQEHVNGAAALAKMRGTSQFKSKAGIRMFMMLTQTVMISCIQRDMPMPQTLVDLRNELGGLLGSNDPAWRIPTPIYKILQVRYDIKCGHVTDSAAIVEKLISIDKEFISVIADFPSSWQYRAVGISQSHPTIFSDYCHVYPGLVVATTWNGLRSMRMLVQETIIGELVKTLNGQAFTTLPHKDRLQLAKSIALLENLRDAIIASVPQHFGMVSWRDTKPNERDPTVSTIAAKKPPSHIVPSPASAPSSPDSTSDFNGPTLYDPTQAEGVDDGVERFMILASASNTIVWPLYLLGVSSCCTQEVKEYVIARLMAIYEETGLPQALAVVGMVQGKEISNPWSDWPLEDLVFVDDESSPVPI